MMLEKIMTDFIETGVELANVRKKIVDMQDDIDELKRSNKALLELVSSINESLKKMWDELDF